MAESIFKLKVDSQEYDSKIKRATQGLLQMEEYCRKVGGTMAILDKEEKEFVKSLGSMETVSKTARGSLGELTAAFTDLSIQYKRLTDEEKKGDYGQALSSSLEQLKARIQDTKGQLAEVNRELNGVGGGKFGEFGNVLDTIGNKMGINANLTELLTSKTALLTAGIGASVAILGKASDQLAKYNSELSRQDQVTKVTTGMSGAGADRMTDQARALSDTYGVDFRETINAANTLMTQFGQSGEQAMQLIKDGMQGMIQGDGPKLLSMIQQYAPSFRDAGIEASQLVAIIHNSEGGIFTDQNMSAITMGIKNIRLMTKQTNEALGRLGIDGVEMTRKLNDGTMTIFEAMRQVAEAIERTGSSSQAAGEVMQAVFGRQGYTAGTNLGKAIATLNTNLEETKKQTGEVGEAFADLQKANERLNTAIRDAFGYDGWQQMATGIKTELVGALSSVIEKLGAIRKWFGSFTQEGTAEQWYKRTNVDRMIDNLGNGQGEKALQTYQKQLEAFDKVIKKKRLEIASLGNDAIESGMKRRVQAELDGILQAREEYVRRANELHKNGKKQIEEDKLSPTTSTTTPSPTSNIKSTASEQTELQKNQKAIADLTEEYQRLADVSKTATGQTLNAATERMTAIKTEIKALQDRNDELKRWADEAAGKTTGLIEEQTKKAARLNEELTHATTVADIQRINKELEATNDRLTILRGKLPENKTAEFKVELDAKQLAELQDKLPKGATITERVNVEQGEVDMPDVPTDDKTIRVNVEQGEVDMPDVPTDDKTINVNVEQGEVNLPDVPTNDKTIKVNVEQGEVDMPDVPTDVKQLVTVTADTAEAAQAIAALVDGNYTVTIAAKMNMEEGFAGLSDNALTAYIAGLKKDLSGEEIGSDFYNKIAQNMGDATALQNVIKTAVAAGFDLSGFDLEMPWEQILSFDDADDALSSLIEQINEKLKEIGKDPIKINLQTGADESKAVTNNAKETQKAWSAAASAINSASSAMQNMEDPAAKVAGIVMQAVANIALGFAQASASPATGAAGIFGWIAAVTAGLATMTATIAAVKSATKGGFAEGGIVPGNSYSGDLLRTSDYGINSGELILNRAQQNNIASQLENNSMSNLNLTATVYGEQIRLALNNGGRRTGRGEYVQSNYNRG